MDIFAGLTAAGQALDIAKGLRAVEKSYDTVELKMQVVDLIDKLVEVKGALQDARDKLSEKDERIRELLRAESTKDLTILHAGMRYDLWPESTSQPQGFPYCSRCEEVEGKLVHTTAALKSVGAHCPQCKSEYRMATIFAWAD